jgi:DNA-binding transcriptional LysR family regulator
VIEQPASAPVRGADPRRVLGVELRHLEALAAIAREGSFWGAAESLGYVQSAVSSQLARLEQVLDVRLVERSRGRAPVALTVAGQLLLEHTEVVLERLGDAQAELAEVAEAKAESVRIAAWEVGAKRLLPRITTPFAGSRPDVDVEIREAESEASLLAMLEADEIDLALCELPTVDGEFAGVGLIEDPFVLLVGAGTAVGRRTAPPSATELADLPVIGCDLSRATAGALESARAHGIEPDPRVRSDSPATVEALVGAGIGVAILPRLALDPGRSDVKAIELPGLPSRTLGLSWRGGRERSPAASAFARAARAACAEPHAD